MGQNPFCLVYTFAAQNPVARFGHFYIFEFADPFVFAGKFHNDAACGATAEQTVFLVALFNEHTLRAAHHGSAAFCGAEHGVADPCEAAHAGRSFSKTQAECD